MFEDAPKFKPPAGTPYYVQLAAYASESLATGLAASLAATYPVLVLSPAAGSRQVYRVLVGPLNRAESGTLLRWFRNRGFPDAFVNYLVDHHARLFFASGNLSVGLRLMLRLVQHRIREAVLGEAFDPAVLKGLPEAAHLSGGAGVRRLVLFQAFLQAA